MTSESKIKYLEKIMDNVQWKALQFFFEKLLMHSIWHTKADTTRRALNRLNICFKHAAALGIDVDLQATAKAKTLLGKQRYKTKTHLQWIGEIFRFFIKRFAKQQP